jgi:hypothetical protein
VNKKSVIIIVAVLLILLMVLSVPRFIANSRHTMTSTATLVAGCVDASNEISGITCSWLAQHASVWKPAQNTSIGWAVAFPDASYDNIETTSEKSLQSDLNMLLSSGASCIRIDIGYDAWLSNNVTAQHELENITSQIKSAGKCLIVADASAEYYRSHPLDWTQFRVAWISRVKSIAAILHPSFYLVIKEPGWYVPMVSDARTNPQFQNATVWIQLEENLADAPHLVSPSTQVGVSIEGGIPASNQPFFVSFLKGASQFNGTSFIGYDQYGASDMLLDLSLESQVKTTKPIWIAEAWSTATPAVAENPARASLDAYWIQVLYYYALYMHASVVEPFFTDMFASYTIPPNFGMRTSVFYEFHHLATTYGAPIA